MRLNCGAYLLAISILSCNATDSSSMAASTNSSSDSSHRNTSQITIISTGKTTPAELINFARSLNGIPYKYGSTNPAQGFDCSGFVTYVFNHFDISVSRSSVDFTFVKQEIDVKDAQPGDLILFTGTDSTIKTVGHMGIIIAVDEAGPRFIHATSGKAHGVTETSLYPKYAGRYMKTIRIFPQNNR